VFLLDQTHLTNAYPELTVSRGKGATITLNYAEALVNDKQQKGNRNEIEGKQLIGFEDQFLADGQKRTFRPLWFRTYRYVQLTVETAGEPVVLEDFVGQYTGYPLAEKATFASSDSTLADIWTVGWRTARLCAGETYFDCPYYEQLQYVGDTRVQSMISLYVSGDDRLMRKAILDFDHSRIPDGLTQSRYPSADLQVIPTFSLFWVCMIHDYWMHRQDDAFVKSLLPGMADVMRWHEKRLAANNLNGPLEWWNFVDWAWPWSEEARIGGVPPGVRDGSSTLSLQQAYTYLLAAEVFAHYGQNDVAEGYRGLAARIKKAVRETCWDANRGLMADTPAKKTFSQHANILAILTDAVPIAQQPALLQKTMVAPVNGPNDITQATFYFKYYLFEALKKTGMGDQLIPQLKPWRDMMAMGLTTFAESPDRSDGPSTRSDCHAWSASPLYEFLSTVCGINPAEPGFRSVRIEPFLGNLMFAEGRMPHPSGEIAVRFEKTATGGLKGTISLPMTLTGALIWKGKTVVLRGGKQEVSL
jgi:alpha-L-rhamnosidase